MNESGIASNGRSGAGLAPRPVWMVLIVAGGACLSPFFACVTPFAAVATVAALKLGGRDAFASVGLVWLANQVIGYGFLAYPVTWDSGAWGVAIGASSGLAVIVAKGLSSADRVPLAISLPFVGAFAAFELGLYLAGVVLPVSDAAFRASVIGNVFLVNAAALCGLLAVYSSAAGLGIVGRRDAAADLLALSGAAFR